MAKKQRYPKPVKSKDRCKDQTQHDHPEHLEFLPRLKRAQGQIQGIEKMIQDQRYCVDILVQFRAVMASLRSIEVKIFEKHLQHCLSCALHSQDKKRIDEKILELTKLLVRRTSL